jgi:hypothetical protein
MPLPISSRVYLLSVLMDVLSTPCSRITYRTCSHSTIVFSRRDRLWPISFGVNDTKKAKRLIAERQKLMWHPGGNIHGVEWLHLVGSRIKNGSALASHGNDDMRMLVFFEAGVTARRDFKISHMKLGGFCMATDEYLADDGLPFSAGFLAVFIGFPFDSVPCVAIVAVVVFMKT